MSQAGVKSSEGVDHHGGHDVHPPGAYDGDGAIEIEDADARVASGRRGPQAFDSGLRLGHG